MSKFAIKGLVVPSIFF